MLSDSLYREWVLKQVKDPALKAIWTREIAAYDKRFFSEVVAPIQNKVGQLLLAAPLRNILGQVASKFTPRFTIDRQRIFIANLSKGLVGEDKANLLGAVLVSQFQAAATSRADTPEEERRDFTLFIDELHNFTTDSFASILAELRKYHLGLVVGHQHLAQLAPEVRNAVFGNVGSLISFRVGESDAAVLSREFGGGFDPALFSNLSNGEICVKLLQDGHHGDPFLAKTNPPTGKRYGRKYNLIRRSRERYATPREVVEAKIHRWLRS
jgi:hypothetical protein